MAVSIDYQIMYHNLMAAVNAEGPVQSILDYDIFDHRIGTAPHPQSVHGSWNRRKSFRIAVLRITDPAAVCIADGIYRISHGII